MCRAAARSPALASVVARSSEAFVGRPFGPMTRLAGKRAHQMAKRRSSCARPRQRATASDSQDCRRTRFGCHPQLFDLWVIADAELCLLFTKLRFETKNDRHGFCRETRLMFLPPPHSSPYQRLAHAGVASRAPAASSLAQELPLPVPAQTAPARQPQSHACALRSRCSLLHAE